LNGDKRVVCPIIDARRGDVYTAVYKNGKRTTDYRAMQLVDLLLELKGQDVVFVGDGAINFEQDILDAGFDVAHEGTALQRASSVGLVAFAQKENAVSAYELAPFYLRQTQAEREYAQKHGSSK